MVRSPFDKDEQISRGGEIHSETYLFRFCCPRAIISDGRKHFNYQPLQMRLKKYGVELKTLKIALNSR